MQDIDNGLREISEIRSMMERASKFLSLSGLAGVSAGLVGVGGSVVAGMLLREDPPPTVGDIVVVALVVLLLAVGASLFFTRRMALKRGLPVWDAAARRLTAALLVPLAAGGAVCIALVLHAQYALIPSMMLVFYGLALVQASMVTREEVRWLGLSEVLLGVAAGFWPDWGVVLWGTGFGVLHIVYGTVMYYRYDREIPPRTVR